MSGYDSDEDRPPAAVADNSQIEVYGRIRPSPHNDHTLTKLSGDHRRVEIFLPKEGLAPSISSTSSGNGPAGGYVNHKKENWEFSFQHVFDETATQEDVFNHMGKKVVDNVLQGFNGTIFAYGQTGSGKTFSITGGQERYEDRGLIPRTLSMIFAEKEARANEYTYNVSISYLEIYMNEGYDLLDANHDTKSLSELPKVAMFEDESGHIHMRNIHLLPANTVDEALNLLFVGDTNRCIAETPSNDASSRSHCIFTIYLESREVGGSKLRRSKLHLVDLAGSERVKKTQIQGKILTEALHINLALHYLEQVIVALHKRARDKTVHIPYRNSMMTSVLRDSLGGNCKTVMLATLSAQRPHLDESISTCRFAARVAMIRNVATINEELDPRLLIKRLKMQVRELKEEITLLKSGALMGEGGGGGESGEGGPALKSLDRPLDPDEVARCRQLVTEYLTVDKPPKALQDVTFMTRPKIEACFEAWKEMLAQAQAQAQANAASQTVDGSGQKMLLTDGTGNGTGSGSTPLRVPIIAPKSNPALEEELKRLRLALASRDNEISILVSMLRDKGPGNSYGAATNSNSSPTPGMDVATLEEVRQRAREKAQKDTGINASELRGSGSEPMSALQQSLLVSKGVEQLRTLHASSAAPHTGTGLGAPLESDAKEVEARLKAFDLFRRSYRKNQLLEEQKDTLRSKIELAQKLGEAINAARNEINHLKTQLEQHRMSRGAKALADGSSDPEVALAQPDEAEDRIRSRIEESKKRYRANFEQLKAGKNEIEHLKAVIEKSRRKLQADFETWWAQQKQIQQSGGATGAAMESNAVQASMPPHPHPQQSPTSSFNTPRTHSASIPSHSSQTYPSTPSSNNSHIGAPPPSSSSYPTPASHRSTYSSGGGTSNGMGYAMQRPPSSASSSASVRSSLHTPRDPVSTTSLGGHNGPRLLSTGNAQADADIQKFYAMRDQLLQQQQRRS